ncbi:MAG: DnaJ domain-containing protein [Proteobacteria bacterium]|nr:DnaJ domain-containing protein [Pseudomonadota bacterium]
MDTQADPIARKDSPVRLVPGLDLMAARLSAQEGFVLSRIAGETTVQLLCDGTGLGDAATIATLRTLYDKGFIIVADQRATPVVPRPPAAAVPAPAGPLSGSGSVELDERLGLDTAELAQVDTEEATGIDLKRELRLRLRSVRRRLKEMSFFELLGLAPDADAKALRRAYFERSKEFHPDRYYTKNLGPYKEMLAEIFRQSKAAYEYLQDEDKRAAYRVLVLAQQEEEQIERQLRRQSAEALEVVHLAGPPPPATPSGDEGSAEQSAPPLATPVVPSLPWRDRRDTAGAALFQRSLRERLVTSPRGVTTRPPTAPLVSAAVAARGPATVESVEADSAERASRRDRDQARQQRQRQQRVAGTLGGGKRKAQDYFEQGLKQLEEGKLLAAAASLKLAATFDPDNLEYARRSETVGREARASTADGYFKRALLEEQVGRTETAALYFQRAADASGLGLHLQRAAEGMMWLDDLKNAREYATKALQAEPNSVDARLVLARVLLAGGLKEHARREVDLALKLAPGHPGAKELLKRIKKA